MEEVKEKEKEIVILDRRESETLGAFALALSKAQGEFPSIGKDKPGYGYEYATLSATIDAVKPILSKHRIATVQQPGDCTGGYSTVTTKLIHESGEFMEVTSKLPNPDMKSCNDTQKSGGGISYIRRYALQAMLCIASEDNDASSKEAPKAPVRSAPKAAAAPKSSDDSFRNMGGI